MTQREKVLRLLQEAGPSGLHTFELRAAYVANPSQRVSELEEDGHAIHRRRERLRRGGPVGCRYTLIRRAAADGVVEAAAPAGPEAPVSSPPAGRRTGAAASSAPPAADVAYEAAPLQLFDPARAHHPRGAYQEEGAA